MDLIVLFLEIFIVYEIRRFGQIDIWTSIAK